MKKIIWHYFCRNQRIDSDKYLKYLLISLDSLINIGKVNPDDIFISLDIPDNFENIYLKKILNYKTNIKKAPKYKNHAKITNLYNVIKENPDAEKVVQIDCDVLINDEDIIDKISNLEEEALLSNTTVDYPLYKVMHQRDGQRHPVYTAEHVPGAGTNHSRNIIFSVVPTVKPDNLENSERRYECFKDFLKINFNFDLEDAIEKIKKEDFILAGYLYVINIKKIPEDVLRFVAVLDLFFADDELIWTLARIYSNIEFNDINKKEKILHQASTIDSFKKLKGMIHFPVKDEEIKDDIEIMVEKILNANNK